MASTEIDFQPAKPQKTGVAAKWEGFKNFCYNPQHGTFCGRTGKSWAKIGVFYLIYYSMLAAFSAIMMAIFFTTIHDREPKQQGMDSLIKGNPGMAYRPMPNVESTLIKFSSGEETSFKKYTEALDTFLKPYSDPELDELTRSCPSGKLNADPVNACKFELSQLGDKCTSGNNYGYYEGMPCIAIKMNRVFNWKPETYSSSDAPTDLPQVVDFNDSIPITCEGVVFDWIPEEYTNDTKDLPPEIANRLQPGFLPVTCEGEQFADVDNIGEVEFYPSGGFPIQYFPYKNQPGYRSPIVMARFANALPGALIQVWCKVWAKNIYHHKNDKAGSFRFELLIN